MHDLDRTTPELEGETFSYEFDAEADGEAEGGELEAEGESGMELEAEAEAQLDELASELLEVGNEAELEQFLGGLIQRVAHSMGTRVRGPMGRRLGLHLKRVLRQMPPFMAYPQSGGGRRSRFGSERLTRLGPGRPPPEEEAGAVSSEVFGLELEGLSHEDQELEMARQVVQLAADAAQTALSTPHEQREDEVSQGAVAQAVERFAPGLAGTRLSPAPLMGAATSGRWVRKGSRIILLGA
ncbi:hypothetical protein [Corallococcus exercitus]|uniref:hypothetical protein n=1 Tax=Corallococcus exercitus TaxID=2316736 RepID=UPI0035D45614